MDSLIKDIGRSYVVSSLLPAALFVLLFSLFFPNIIPNVLKQTGASFEDGSLGALLSNRWIAPVIIASWLGFALFSSVDWIVKLFEGYWIKEKTTLYDWLLKKQQDRYDQMLGNTELLQVWIKYKQWLRDCEEEHTDSDGNVDARTVARLSRKKLKELKKPEWQKNPPNTGILRAHSKHELGQAELVLPLDRQHLLPTDLGNILRASELYSLERYHFDALTTWNRLYKILPAVATKELEEKNNQLMFLLNSALLMYLLTVTAGLGMVVVQGTNFYHCYIERVVCRYGQPVDIWNFVGYYLVLAGIFCLAGYRLYRLSLHTAEDYGLIVRSCIDLYRLDLLKKLHFPLPQNYDEEIYHWHLIEEFMLAGLKLELDWVQYAETHLNYHYGKDDQQYLLKKTRK